MVRLWTIQSLSSGAIVRQCSRTPVRKGYNNIISHNKRPDGKWGKTAVGVNGVGGWRHTRKRWSWIFLDFEKMRSLRSTAEGSGCVFRIWSDQISLGLDRQKWVEILVTTRCAVNGGRGECQHSMVSIGFYDLCLSPCVAKSWRQNINKPVCVRNDRVRLYYYYVVHRSYTT